MKGRTRRQRGDIMSPIFIPEKNERKC